MTLISRLGFVVATFCAMSISIDAFAGGLPMGCIGMAANAYGLPPKLLHSLYLAERGEVGKAVYNKSNGTYDHGPFQINTIWLGKLGPYGITANDLMNSPRINATTAAWLLRSQIILAKGDVWRGVGNYRSKTPRYHNEEVYRVAYYYRALPDTISYTGTC